MKKEAKLAYCKQYGINATNVVEHYVNKHNESIHKIVLANGDVHVFCAKTLIRLN